MHDADLGMALDLGPGRRMDQKLAEQAAERLVLLDAHLLVAEEEHLMRHQRIVQLARLPVGERPARSTPETSAPIAGVSLRIAMVS